MYISNIFSTTMIATHDSLGVGVDGGNLQAARALNVHEEGVRSLNELPQLVLALFLVLGRVQQIDIHLES